MEPKLQDLIQLYGVALGMSVVLSPSRLQKRYDEGLAERNHPAEMVTIQ
jgi:hypothetical protein